LADVDQPAGAPSKTSDLPVRLASAIVMVAIAGTALWLGGWVWTAFVALVGLGVFWEWSRLAFVITDRLGGHILLDDWWADPKLRHRSVRPKLGLD